MCIAECTAILRHPLGCVWRGSKCRRMSILSDAPPTRRLKCVSDVPSAEGICARACASVWFVALQRNYGIWSPLKVSPQVFPHCIYIDRLRAPDALSASCDVLYRANGICECVCCGTSSLVGFGIIVLCVSIGASTPSSGGRFSLDTNEKNQLAMRH